MQKIIDFLKSAGLPDYVLQKNVEGFRRHPDIAEEFIEWLETGKYREENPVRVEGYTAKDIAELADFLDGAGAFNFLITLRERPEKAKTYIKEGFRIK
ncbi:MAG TPA: hypothetical protein PK369_04260 [Thermoclostridium sp.]|nr:hypothetical protein [Clostridiaceae bacterium]HOQ75769.1 hypothetical protein [Thermoclostridium sp.]